jgi:hypothetical protein
MTDKDEVNKFLADFKAKLAIWQVVYRDDRNKNTQTLLTLELTPAQRTEILKKLTADDYSEGPLEEKLYQGVDMWVFGKLVKQKEVYIKITLGAAGTSVICISFHIAAHKMNYPLK